MTSILVIADHPVVHKGLRKFLSEEIRDAFFGEAKNQDQALRELSKRPWSMIILDIASPDGEGLDLLRELRKQHPDAKILMYGDQQERWCASRCMSLGAYGFVSKRDSLTEVSKAVRSVLAGEKYCSRSVSPKGRLVASRSQDDQGVSRKPLSTREGDILIRLCNGKRPSEIAAELGLDIRTVSTYKRRLLDKLHLDSTASLIRYAIDYGIC